MPVPRFDNFFFKWIYPAALTAFGVGANAYILRGKIREVREVKGDLKEGTSEAKEVDSEVKAMDSEVKEMDSELKVIADEIRAFARLQAALELQNEATAETFFQDCVKEKLKLLEWQNEG